MKKAMVFFVVVAMVCCTSVAYAATENIPEGMGKKAIRGAVDMVTGIVELPMQIIKGYKGGFGPIENTAGSKTVGTILGIFRGFGHTAGRIAGGGMELFGFWAANPEDNEGIGVPFDGQYSWQEGEQYSLFKPSLKEGVAPIGRKLAHGIANGFTGIAELPGQTMRGVSDGNAVKGLGKGVWFWFSRSLYGFGEIFTCLVPNHPDNPGYPFNGDWPWTALTEEIEPVK
ncbi:MAG: hypothetical protein KKH94_08285 [Candidatus Omnitrophica bacterium]|nr:hypothetical protein [Candidatus Omnitrophota bacterium]